MKSKRDYVLFKSDHPLKSYTQIRKLTLGVTLALCTILGTFTYIPPSPVLCFVYQYISTYLQTVMFRWSKQVAITILGNLLQRKSCFSARKSPSPFRPRGDEDVQAAKRDCNAPATCDLNTWLCGWQTDLSPMGVRVGVVLQKLKGLHSKT